VIDIENIRLMEFRKLKNLSQSDMANRLNISTSFYIKIELGERNPSYNFIKKFKKTFECDIDKIFFGEQLHI
jgi:putative transcriptional regulator